MDEEEETRLWFEQELKRVRILGLEPRHAEMLRWFCTAIGIAKHCPFKVCRRAKACSTDRVLCWQIMREDLNPILRRVRALAWKESVERGEAPDISPAMVTTNIRILEEIEESDFAPSVQLNGNWDTVANETGEPK